MTKKRFFMMVLPLAIFIGILFFLWKGLYHDPRVIPSPLLNKLIPAFSAPTLQNPQRLITERDFAGRVTILNVFASWCVACEAEHSVWIEGRQELQPQTQIIGLNYKDERQKALAWLDHYGNPYNQVIYDPQGIIGIDFGVYGTPETFIIDKQGIIRYKFIGAVSPADWKQTILPEIRKWEKS